MLDLKRIAKKRSIFYSKPVLFALFAILCFLIFVTAKVYVKNRDAEAKKKSLQNQLNELEHNRTELEKRITEIQSPSGAEKELREKLNVVRPEEKMVVIIEKNGENGKIDSDSNSGSQDFFSKFWQRIKSLF